VPFSKGGIAVALVVLVSSLGWGQQAEISKPSFLVHMSLAGPFRPYSSPVCFAADLNGHYQMRRLKETQHTVEKDGRQFVYRTVDTEWLQGTLAASELKQLKELLGDSEFVSLTSQSNLIRKGGEVFAVDVARERDVQRVVVTNADDSNPFPPSVQKLVGWLSRFKAEDAEPLNESEADACPGATLQPTNPAIAILR
jgi:hypothetical protein